MVNSVHNAVQEQDLISQNVALMINESLSHRYWSVTTSTRADLLRLFWEAAEDVWVPSCKADQFEPLSSVFCNL